MVMLAFDEVVRKVAGVLEAHGYSRPCAEVLAVNCVTAQRDGSVSHGLFRLKDYLATIASGYVNGDPTPRLDDVAPGFLRVDADNGFAQFALVDARDLLTAKATQNGIAILAIRNSHHLGALYLDVEEFTRDGLIALAVVNSDVLVAPPGGARAVYGTNPMAFAAPRASGGPVIFDQAAATIAHGDLQVAAREGRRLPETSGIDAHGRPTGDAIEILDGGALSTFGGHKGASIALMVEILCAAVAGADFSHEVPQQRPAEATTARTGETVIVIDPRAGADDLRDLPGRVDTLVAALSAAGQSRIPGERHVAVRSRAGRLVEVGDECWAEIEQLYLGGAQSNAPTIGRYGA